MENNKNQKLKVTCYKNPDYEIYQNKYPMIVNYEPEMFILSTCAREYILEFQKVFQKRSKDNLDKKIKPIENDLNDLVLKYREEGKLYFQNEIDLTPQGQFPQRLVNNQIAILPGMVRLKPKNIDLEKEKKAAELRVKNGFSNGEYEEMKIGKKINIKKGCNKC